MLNVFACRRDGLRESNVVTKTFQVDDAGPPSDDPDEMLARDGLAGGKHFQPNENDYRPIRSSLGPRPSSSSALIKPKVN